MYSGPGQAIRQYRAGVGGATFAPTDIAGLQTWHKADSLALSDGAAVSSWSDSSGNGNTATQATGANQPIYKTAIINGQPIVRFDGSNDRLQTASITHNVGTGAFTWSAVIKTHASHGSDKAYMALGSFRPAGYVGSSGKVDLYLGGDNLFDTVLSTSTWYTITIIRNASQVITCYLNGTAEATTPTDTDDINNSSVLTIGDDGGGFGYYDSDIAEVLFYNVDIGSTNRGSLESYLRSKYAHY